MVFAVPLCLGAASAARVEDLCNVLTERGISDYAARLGYRPQVTLIRGDNIKTSAALPVLNKFASQPRPLPIRLDAIAEFPGDTSVL
jgi:hypothetical protein